MGFFYHSSMTCHQKQHIVNDQKKIGGADKFKSEDEKSNYTPNKRKSKLIIKEEQDRRISEENLSETLKKWRSFELGSSVNLEMNIKKDGFEVKREN